MVTMVVYGYLCLIVRETTEDNEHEVYWHACQSVAKYLRKIDLLLW